jgi:DNA segregation ATPase FtsK/SpoIIIE, S-DNA-T family
MTTDSAGAPAFPLSFFDPVHLGTDEYGEHVAIDLAERNILIGGEPGAGKSSAVNLIVAHVALSADACPVLIDGKQVELGPWRHCAHRFVGPSIDDAIDVLRWLQAEMNRRYDNLLNDGLRKLTRNCGLCAYPVFIDEYAYFSATIGTKAQQAEFAALTRDHVARGRAAAIPVILATQRPSHQVIDPSMRDLFSWRLAFRCTTDSSSDVVLGHGWASEGYTAADIDPLARGVGWLLSESGVPRRIKTAWLTDADVASLAATAAALRGTGQAA